MIVSLKCVSVLKNKSKTEIKANKKIYLSVLLCKKWNKVHFIKVYDEMSTSSGKQRYQNYNYIYSVVKMCYKVRCQLKLAYLQTCLIFTNILVVCSYITRHLTATFLKICQNEKPTHLQYTEYIKRNLDIFHNTVSHKWIHTFFLHICLTILVGINN